MNAEYLEELTSLLEQARPGIVETLGLEFKGVFGAVGGYVGDSIFITCGRFGVAVRLSPDALERVFEQDGVEQLRYFPKGHIKREYAVLPGWLLEDSAHFGSIVDDSVAYVRCL